jgi:Na+/melibiose symporter-like transporter
VSVGVIVALFVGTVLPALTEVFTQRTASVLTRATVTGTMSVLTGAITTALIAPPTGTPQWQELFMAVVISLASSVAAYYWAWKPSGASDRIARATASFGIE